MCGVPVNAAPDMTGLGGKARMVTTSVAESSAADKNSDRKEDADAVKAAKNLLLEVNFSYSVISIAYICPASCTIYANKRTRVSQLLKC